MCAGAVLYCRSSHVNHICKSHGVCASCVIMLFRRILLSLWVIVIFQDSNVYVMENIKVIQTLKCLRTRWNKILCSVYYVYWVVKVWSRLKKSRKSIRHSTCIYYIKYTIKNYFFLCAHLKFLVLLLRNFKASNCWWKKIMISAKHNEVHTCLLLLWNTQKVTVAVD